MCLGVPGKIIAVYEANGIRMGKVDFGGVVREACLAYTPEACPGDYIIVHVGFAISLLSEQEAMESLDLIRQLADFDEEAASTPGQVPS